MNLVFLLFSWKIDTFFSKMKRSKVTGYAALNIVNVLYITTFKALFQPSMTIFIARNQKSEIMSK